MPLSLKNRYDVHSANHVGRVACFSLDLSMHPFLCENGPVYVPVFGYCLKKSVRWAYLLPGIAQACENTCSSFSQLSIIAHPGKACAAHIAPIAHPGKKCADELPSQVKLWKHVCAEELPSYRSRGKTLCSSCSSYSSHVSDPRKELARATASWSSNASTTGCFLWFPAINTCSM